MIGLKLIDDKTIKTVITKDINLVFDSVRDSFKALIRGEVCHPLKTRIARPGSATLDDWIFSMPAYLSGVENVAGVKWASRFPGASVGNVHILLVLNDTSSNKPIAIMDGAHISHFRTFAITKLSIDFLKLLPKKICIIGMGNIGRIHAQNLKKLYGSIEKIKCFSFNAKYDDLLEEKVEICSSLEEALDSADIVISCGQKRPPYITSDMISSDTKLIVNLSLFDFDPSVFKKADIILVDDMNALNSSIAPLGQEVRTKNIDLSKISLIGEYITGDKILKSKDGLVVVNTFGMVVQDLVLGKRVLKQLDDSTFDEFKIV